MRKISEVLRLRFDLNCSHRNIARALNISASTVAEYLGRAKIACIGWPLPENMSEEVLYNRLFLPVSPIKQDLKWTPS